MEITNFRYAKGANNEQDPGKFDGRFRPARSQGTSRKYLAFAQVADKEGLPQVAKLFRAAAAAETIHAHAHLKNAGKIGDTAANLQSALEGETYEFTKMYPEMIKDAEAEGKTAVAKYFRIRQQGGRSACQPLQEGHCQSFRSCQCGLLRLQDLRLYPRRPCEARPVCGGRGFVKVEECCKVPIRTASCPGR